MKSTRFASSLGGMLLAASLLAQAGDAPSGLLCNLLTQPEKCVITEPQPDFGWIVNSSQTADRQTAYQIAVASSPALLENGGADLWDSGKVASGQSINVLYRGKPLAANSSYWWRVRTWDKDGKPSAPSKPQRFNTGVFNRADKKWPGESRWIQLADDKGNQTWTFEDRPPVAFHPNPAASVVEKPDGTWFLDFGKAAFATLELTISWTPSTPDVTGCVVQVAVGEKSKGTSVDPKPGGGIIYRKVPLEIQPGKRLYTLELPRFVPHYPHSQAMPKQLPDVVPFRYCELMPGAEKITVEAPTQLALWVDFDDAASTFTSSNKSLNAIYDLCRYSVKVNTFNGDYAASERERMMYEADSYIHQMSHYAVDRAFRTARYTSENMIFHASWPTEWISHSIFMAWTDYLHTGNSRSMARYYDELKPKTLLALTGPDHLISTRTGLQNKPFHQSIHLSNSKLTDIVDWPTGEADGYDFKDFNTVVNACHYQSLVQMAKIAAALDKQEDAKFYQQHAGKVLAAINAGMFDSQRGIYVDGIGSSHASLHANLFPLAFGIVPDKHRRTVVDFIKSRGMACSVYPTVYLLEALYDAGEEQAALDLMTSDSDRSWLNMIRVGSTVTTEAWDIKYKKNSGWTHAWSSAPAQILPRKLVGIEPLEPGFGKVRIQPRPGNLTHASTRLPTIRGFIDAGFKREGSDSFVLDVTLPANMTAEVALPDLGSLSDELTVNGRRVKGRLASGRVWLTDLGSGTHRIVRHGGK
jgi:alpha-L-rhamnosidase